MTRRITQSLAHLSALNLALVMASQSCAQTEPETAINDSTVTYEAAFFDQYSPVSVSDMVDRIPGIGLALNRGRGGGNNGRGLGSGEGEILINGQRITGKSNEGSSQLSRISANQVAYIEIIRGTSDELDVRGGGQVVNVVLLDAQSRSSIAAELNLDRHSDSHVEAGAKVSFSGQSGALNYLFHVEAEPRYSNERSVEVSRDAAAKLLETRSEERVRDQNNFETSFNLGYQFDRSLIQLNGLYAQSSPPADIERTITDFSNSTPITSMVREESLIERSNWEVGGDYEYQFGNDSKYRFLFIVNDFDFGNTRERFDVISNADEKNLFLFNSGRDRERIARTSYTFDLQDNQGVELGVERAQTIRDSELRLGLATGNGIASAEFGGLIPVDVSNSHSTVEEIRDENFAVHNWQINDIMSLESSLIYETSTIEQSGDVGNKRDFSFLRPKLDYRFDLSESLQLRATIEKTVSQLSFSDFSASTDNSDDDQNTLAGNPDITQQQAWNYVLNLEYRLPNDVGVLNSELYYRDIEDVIDRIDVSTGANNLQSSRGNIGKGKRYGINLDASVRLGFIGLPSALLSLSFNLQDSNVTDPFLGKDRRFRRNGRWFGNAEFRHDVTRYNLSYGFNYFNSAQDGSGLTQIDVADIEIRKNDPYLILFVEKKIFEDIALRFDIRNAGDQVECRKRIRFTGATVSNRVEEVEDNCFREGVQYSFQVRHTF